MRRSWKRILAGFMAACIIFGDSSLVYAAESTTQTIVEASEAEETQELIEDEVSEEVPEENAAKEENTDAEASEEETEDTDVDVSEEEADAETGDQDGVPEVPEEIVETMPENTQISESSAETDAEVLNSEKTEEPEIVQIPMVTEVIVNPLYEDVVTEEEIMNAVQAATVSEEDLSTYTTVEAAAVAVREELVERNATIQIGYEYVGTLSEADIVPFADSILEEALEHTGVPKEGDYLRWNYAGCSRGGGGYIENGISYLTLQFNMSYYTTAEMEQTVDSTVDSLLDDLQLTGKTDYGKIRKIYDYICANVTYDHANLNDDNYKLKYTAYAALINKTSVCQGYAMLFYRLALEEGIDARLISGIGNGGPHGWNIVELDDQYYNLDSTWDAGRSTYSYFLKNMEEFTDHVRAEEYLSESFMAAYPMAENAYVEEDEAYKGTVEGDCLYIRYGEVTNMGGTFDDAAILSALQSWDRTFDQIMICYPEDYSTTIPADIWNAVKELKNDADSSNGFLFDGGTSLDVNWYVADMETASAAVKLDAAMTIVGLGMCYGEVTVSDTKDIPAEAHIRFSASKWKDDGGEVEKNDYQAIEDAFGRGNKEFDLYFDDLVMSGRSDRYEWYKSEDGAYYSINADICLFNVEDLEDGTYQMVYKKIPSSGLNWVTVGEEFSTGILEDVSESFVEEYYFQPEEDGFYGFKGIEGWSAFKGTVTDDEWNSIERAAEYYKVGDNQKSVEHYYEMNTDYVYKITVHQWLEEGESIDFTFIKDITGDTAEEVVLNDEAITLSNSEMKIVKLEVTEPTMFAAYSTSPIEIDNLCGTCSKSAFSDRAVILLKDSGTYYFSLLEEGDAEDTEVRFVSPESVELSLGERYQLESDGTAIVEMYLESGKTYYVKLQPDLYEYIIIDAVDRADFKYEEETFWDNEAETIWLKITAQENAAKLCIAAYSLIGEQEIYFTDQAGYEEEVGTEQEPDELEYAGTVEQEEEVEKLYVRSWEMEKAGVDFTDENVLSILNKRIEAGDKFAQVFITYPDDAGVVSKEIWNAVKALMDNEQCFAGFSFSNGNYMDENWFVSEMETAEEDILFGAQLTLGAEGAYGSVSFTNTEIPASEVQIRFNTAHWNNDSTGESGGYEDYDEFVAAFGTESYELDLVKNGSIVEDASVHYEYDSESAGNVNLNLHVDFVNKLEANVSYDLTKKTKTEYPLSVELQYDEKGNAEAVVLTNDGDKTQMLCLEAIEEGGDGFRYLGGEEALPGKSVTKYFSDLTDRFDDAKPAVYTLYAYVFDQETSEDGPKVKLDDFSITVTRENRDLVSAKIDETTGIWHFTEYSLYEYSDANIFIGPAESSIWNLEVGEDPEVSDYFYFDMEQTLSDRMWPDYVFDKILFIKTMAESDCFKIHQYEGTEFEFGTYEKSEDTFVLNKEYSTGISDEWRDLYYSYYFTPSEDGYYGVKGNIYWNHVNTEDGDTVPVAYMKNSEDGNLESYYFLEADETYIFEFWIEIEANEEEVYQLVKDTEGENLPVLTAGGQTYSMNAGDKKAFKVEASEAGLYYLSMEGDFSVDWEEVDVDDYATDQLIYFSKAGKAYAQITAFEDLTVGMVSVDTQPLALDEAVVISADENSCYEVDVKEQKLLYLKKNSGYLQLLAIDEDGESIWVDNYWITQNGEDCLVIPIDSRAVKLLIFFDKNNQSEDEQMIVTDSYQFENQLSEWSGSIKVPAHSERIFSYEGDLYGDFYISEPANAGWMDADFSSIYYDDYIRELWDIESLEDHDYKGFGCRYYYENAEPTQLIFRLYNRTDEELTFELKTNEDFEVWQLQDEGDGHTTVEVNDNYYNDDWENFSYYTFTPETTKYCSLHYCDWIYRVSDRTLMPKYNVILEAREEYLIRFRDTYGIVAEEAVACSGTSVRFTDELSFKCFTPTVSGDYYIEADGVIRLWNPETLEFDDVSEKSYVTLEAGKTYIFRAYSNGQIGLKNEITVLDYDYYHAFIASGGSISIVDGKLQLYPSSSGFSLKEVLLSLLGLEAYEEHPREAFMKANAYWTGESGTFAPTKYYRLSEDRTLSDCSKEQVTPGDILVVKYEPEIVWVDSMKVSVDKKTLTEGNTAQISVSVAPATEKYGFKEEPEITYESSDTSIATVDENGVVTPHRPGKVTITVRADERLRYQENLVDEMLTESIEFTVEGSEFTVLDYDFLEAFIASGGSVSLNLFGKLNIEQKNASWNLISKIASFLGIETYEEVSRDSYIEANNYWKTEDNGSFVPVGYYDLSGNDISKEQAVEGGYAVVKYEPEYVWVDRMDMEVEDDVLTAGESTTLKVTPYAATEKYGFKSEPEIRLVSSDPEIAEILPDGTIETYQEGTVFISAYADETLKHEMGLGHTIVSDYVEITVEPSLYVYEVLDDGTVAITGYNGNPTGNLVIPKRIGEYTVSTIAMHAFLNCTGLEKVTLPDTIVEIDPQAFIQTDEDGYWNLDILICAARDSYAYQWAENQQFDVLDPAEGPYALKYEVNEDGTISITGYVGDLPDELIIPDEISGYTVSRIGNAAFEVSDSDDNKGINLSSVQLPETIKSIGFIAFANCSNLKTINIPDSVESIENAAFRYCSSLASLELPEGLTNLGTFAFWNCTSLTELVIPKSLTTVQWGAFYQCANLEKVEILGEQVTLEQNAFNDCEKLQEVDVQGSLASIDNYAFFNCTSLKNITLTNSVETIGDYTFYQGDLKENENTYEKMDITIHCRKGTYAYTWAKEHGFEIESGNYHLIVFNTNGGTIDGETIEGYTEDQGAVLPTNVTKDAYTFAGWYNNAEFTGKAVTEIAKGSKGDKEFYAKWTPVQYQITYHAGNGILPEETIYSYTVEDEITLLNPTLTGYEFAGWYEKVDFRGDAITVIPTGSKENKDFYAKWELVEYTITYHAGEDTDVEPKVYTIVSEEFNLPKIEKAHYEFAGWYKNPAFSGNAVTVVETGSTGNKDFYAKWVPVEYTITLQTNGGAEIGNIIHTIESDTITLPIAERAGYEFAGWYDNAECTGTAVTVIPAGTTGDNTFYAKWETESYEIAYNENGGVLAEETVYSYRIDDPDVDLKAPSRTGYTFAGWYDNALLAGTSVKKIPTGSTGDKTFYAKWTRDTYSIKYVLNGGTAVSDNPKTYNVESEGLILKASTRKGYEFAGWYTKEDFTGEPVTQIPTGTTGNKTFYAKWVPVKYAIALQSNGGEDIADIIYTIESGTITLPEAERAGYEFAGWYTKEDFTGEPVTQIPTGTTGNKTFYAKWVPVKYAITLQSNGGVDIADIIYTIESGTITLPEAERAGYEFAGWYTVSNPTETDQPVSVIEKGMTGDKTFYAKWEPIPYTISYEYNGGSVLEENKIVTKYDVTEAVELPVLEREDYTFIGWFENEKCTGQSIKEIPVGSMGNKMLYAGWSKDSFSITYDPAGGQLASGTVYSYNTTSADVVLKNPTRKGYRFCGWFTTNADGDEVQETVIKKGSTGDKVYLAKWDIIDYSIQYVGEEGYHPDDNPEKYTVEESISLKEPTRDGYTFAGWYTNAKFSGTPVSVIEKGMTGDKTFYAKWVRNTYTITYENLEDATFEVAPAVTYHYDTSVTLQNPVRLGYDFCGWYTVPNPTDEDQPVTEIELKTTGDKVFYAKWDGAVTFEASINTDNLSVMFDDEDVPTIILPYDAEAEYYENVDVNVSLVAKQNDNPIAIHIPAEDIRIEIYEGAYDSENLEVYDYTDDCYDFQISEEYADNCTAGGYYTAVVKFDHDAADDMCEATFKFRVEKGSQPLPINQAIEWEGISNLDTGLTFADIEKELIEKLFEGVSIDNDYRNGTVTFKGVTNKDNALKSGTYTIVYDSEIEESVGDVSYVTTAEATVEIKYNKFSVAGVRYEAIEEDEVVVDGRIEDAGAIAYAIETKDEYGEFVNINTTPYVTGVKMIPLYNTPWGIVDAGELEMYGYQVTVTANNKDKLLTVKPVDPDEASGYAGANAVTVKANYDPGKTVSKTITLTSAVALADEYGEALGTPVTLTTTVKNFKVYSGGSNAMQEITWSIVRDGKEESCQDSYLYEVDKTGARKISVDVTATDYAGNVFETDADAEFSLKNKINWSSSNKAVATVAVDKTTGQPTITIPKNAQGVAEIKAVANDAGKTTISFRIVVVDLDVRVETTKLTLNSKEAEVETARSFNNRSGNGKWGTVYIYPNILAQDLFTGNEEDEFAVEVKQVDKNGNKLVNEIFEIDDSNVINNGELKVRFVKSQSAKKSHTLYLKVIQTIPGREEPVESKVIKVAITDQCKLPAISGKATGNYNTALVDGYAEVLLTTEKELNTLELLDENSPFEILESEDAGMTKSGMQYRVKLVLKADEKGTYTPALNKTKKLNVQFQATYGEYREAVATKNITVTMTNVRPIFALSTDTYKNPVFYKDKDMNLNVMRVYIDVPSGMSKSNTSITLTDAAKKYFAIVGMDDVDGKIAVDVRALTTGNANIQFNIQNMNVYADTIVSKALKSSGRAVASESITLYDRITNQKASNSFTFYKTLAGKEVLGKESVNLYAKSQYLDHILSFNDGDSEIKVEAANAAATKLLNKKALIVETIEDGTVVRITPTADAFGTKNTSCKLKVSLIASDSEGNTKATKSQTITITFDPKNYEPKITLKPSGSLNVADADAAVTVNPTLKYVPSGSVVESVAFTNRADQQMFEISSDSVTEKGAFTVNMVTGAKIPSGNNKIGITYGIRTASGELLKVNTTVTVKVVQTASIKLSASTVTLYNSVIGPDFGKMISFTESKFGGMISVEIDEASRTQLKNAGIRIVEVGKPSDYEGASDFSENVEYKVYVDEDLSRGQEKTYTVKAKVSLLNSATKKGEPITYNTSFKVKLAK